MNSPEQNRPFDTDAIIIGAGPIGLMLANLLGAKGVRTRVFDLRAEPLENSMAIGVTPPSMEILRRLGLDETFHDAGVPAMFDNRSSQSTIPDCRQSTVVTPR